MLLGTLMIRFNTQLASSVAILSLLALSPAWAQGTASSDLRDRFRAAMEKVEALKQRNDPASLVEQAQLLQDGLPVSEANPLKVPRLDEAELLYDQALAVSGAHWPGAAL